MNQEREEFAMTKFRFFILKYKMNDYSDVYFNAQIFN
jgi:hypothetical protein